MKNKYIYAFSLLSSCLTTSYSYANYFSHPSIYESDNGVKAYVIGYESDNNAYLVKMKGTKTVLDNTVIEVVKREGNSEMDTLYTAMYGGMVTLFNRYNDSYPNKIEFINPSTFKKVFLSYDKLDSEESKYSEKDMLKEFKTKENKDKFDSIKKFDRNKMEYKFNHYAKKESEKFKTMCKIDPIPVSYDWSKIADNEIESWKGYYCLGGISSIADYCIRNSNIDHNDDKAKNIHNKIKSIKCIPVPYKDKNQYAIIKGNEIDFYYTVNTVNVDQYMYSFLDKENFNK